MTTDDSSANESNDDSPALQTLKRAQQRVNELRGGMQRPQLSNGDSGDDYASELVTAMNRLMSLIRHATPEDIASFDTWRQGL